MAAGHALDDGLRCDESADSLTGEQVDRLKHAVNRFADCGGAATAPARGATRAEMIVRNLLCRREGRERHARRVRWAAGVVGGLGRSAGDASGAQHRGS